MEYKKKELEMADTSSVDVILDFLRRHQFTKAEAALRTELSGRPDLNCFLQKLNLQGNEPRNVLGEENGDKQVRERQGNDCRNGSEVFKELIVKEIECGGTGRNDSGSIGPAPSLADERNNQNEAVGITNKNFTFSKGSEENLLDLCSWKYNPTNGPADTYQGDAGIFSNNFADLQVSEQSRHPANESTITGKLSKRSGEDVTSSSERGASQVGNSSKANVEPKYERNQSIELKALDHHQRISGPSSKDNFVDNPWSRNEEPTQSTADPWRDCSVKTVFPFSKVDIKTTCDKAVCTVDKKEGKKKMEINDVRAAIKEQVDDVGRSLYFGNTQGSSEHKIGSSLAFPLVFENQKEELPRLPPVKLKSIDKSLHINWEEKFERDGPGPKLNSSENALLIGSFLDVPIGQEISAGEKKVAGGSWLSVSQGIAEDTSDLVSGFATVGDGLSECIDYPNEYWDSDEYDDDDDVGYMRQPIEDETWFLAHEIDYPSDNEKGTTTGRGSVPDPQDRGPEKDEEDDDQSFAEEDSYFSGEQYFQSKNVQPVRASDDPIGLSVTDMYSENDLITQYDGQLMDEEELNLMRAEPVWQGFVTQSNDLIMLGDGKDLNESVRPRLDDICVDDDQHGSVRSIGVGINSDAADIGSEVRESLVGGSSVGDLEYFNDCGHDVGVGGSRRSQHDPEKKYKKRTKKCESDTYVVGNDAQMRSYIDGGFSFPPPLRDGEFSNSQSLWANKYKGVSNNEETDDGLDSLLRTDNNMLSSWKRKSGGSSLTKSSRDGENNNETDAVIRSENSSPSTLSNYGYLERERIKKEDGEKAGGDDAREEEDVGASVEDEEAAAVQEQVRQIKDQEEEFETFNLKIVHRKNRTGFEEDKNFHVVLNSVIAGRYHVTEYLGSAAFSKAIQAHDLHTGMDVCVKIIKNNKDFFDQSLDEIKLLKFVNKNDPADKYHILRLYDYFYYREHLLIVCELLKANLYEFHKFNRESGGEVYFTMPRLQSITIQCLEALRFLHGLGLIHCDLKPENILVKSYSRCEVKVIDLGSSCFETDHLCSYVQSRSYRAPEVILGLPYDKKIDVWSLGCILAELCTGNVLFQNDSPATLLARVIGIIGAIDQGMLAKGRDTYKYFTKNHMLYERNQDTNRLEYLIPKKTSLRHRLPMGDQGFIDFVSHLLEVNPKKRPNASEALKHPWLSYPYEPISS